VFRTNYCYVMLVNNVKRGVALHYCAAVLIGCARSLSRLAVNFTVGLAFSRLRSQLIRDFSGDGGLAFSLHSSSFVQFLHFCYIFAFLTFFLLCVRFLYFKNGWIEIEWSFLFPLSLYLPSFSCTSPTTLRNRQKVEQIEANVFYSAFMNSFSSHVLKDF